MTELKDVLPESHRRKLNVASSNLEIQVILPFKSWCSEMHPDKFVRVTLGPSSGTVRS